MLISLPLKTSLWYDDAGRRFAVLGASALKWTGNKPTDQEESTNEHYGSARDMM